MSGYLVINKDRAIRLEEAVAFLTKRGKKAKSIIISRKNTYYSKTTSKRLSERLEGAKEKDKLFKKER